MKEFLAKSFAVLTLILLVGTQSVKALEWVSMHDTILGNPLGNVLSGESVGNQKSFSVNFDLSKFTDNFSMIENVSLSFSRFISEALQQRLRTFLRYRHLISR